MSPNIAFTYQYKNEQITVVFPYPNVADKMRKRDKSQPEDTSAWMLYAFYGACASRYGNFVAEQVGLPTCYFDEDSDPNAHGWHDILSITETDKEPTDKRPILAFLVEFKAANFAGWSVRRKKSANNC